MEIFNKEYINLTIDAKNKKDALKQISLFAKKINVINDENELYKSLLQREEESSTGFENGFAIPHSRTDNIKKSALLFVRFKNSIDWNSIDKKLTDTCFVILIPKEKETNDHIDTLSKISLSLMDKNFVKNIKQSNSKHKIFEIINNYINSSNDKNVSSTNLENSNTRKILAITACPVGVAHTYLAAEKLITASKENGWDIKVETHGSSGIKNSFTQQEINDCDLIIIASDIGIDLTRFENKKIYQSSVKKAIHNPVELINEAYDKAEINTKIKSIDQNDKKFNSKKQSSIMKHILTGISYMVPFVILGGICIALSIGIGKIIYGQDYVAPKGDFLYYMEKIGAVSFTLMIGALGGYIAFSIAGRAAIAPAFIVSVLGNTPEAIYEVGGLNVTTAMGFLGSIIFGLSIGYTVKWINSWNVPKSINAIMPIFVIPLGVGLIYSLIAIFVIGAPIAWIMGKFIDALRNIFVSNNNVEQNVTVGASVAIGLLIGAMAGFDMGGPINKVAFLTCTSLITSKVYEPMGMMAATIPVAPLGMGLCTMIFRQKFNEQEKSLGVSALIMGFIGISEGAIPFAISDPKKAIPCNMIGSAVAGAIAGGFGVTDAAAHGGPIVGILGAVSSERSYGLAGGIGFFFLAIVIGTLITCLLYGLIRNREIKTIFNKNKKNINI